MENKILYLCLLLACLTTPFIECKWRIGGGSRSWGSASKPSRTSWGSRSKYSGSGYSSYGSGSKYSSSGSSGYGSTYSGSGSKYPPSLTGLSGSGISYSGSGSKYPPSLTGLSGSGASYSGSGSKYPPSLSGLSGSGVSYSGSGSKYPPSLTGLSGSGASYLGSGSKYPPSSSGLSGSGATYSGSGSKYPPSLTGLSGSGATNSLSKYPPSQTGLSGTGVQPVHTRPSGGYGFSSNNNNYNPPRETVYHPSNTYTSKSGYGLNKGYHVPYSYPPTYYSSPQYAYITKYRNSGSRYSDILTGLALYNLGRSYSHHHDHYYHDDYYQRRYHPSGTNYRSNEQNKNVAVCTLRIKENEKTEILKIPCEIVSTFSDNTTTTAMAKQNSTVCVTNTNVINNTLPSMLSNSSSVNSTATTPNITVTNITSCTVVNATDPLHVKGPPVNTTSNMECTVEINTKESRSIKKVDCKTLLEYSKMPEPKKDTVLLPSKSKLKSWISNPPWWISLFVAV